MPKRVFINNYSDTLLTDLLDSGTPTVVQVTDDALLTTLLDGIGYQTGDHLALTLEDGDGIEIIVMTNHDTSGIPFLTVLRGQEGTTQRDWLAGSQIQARATAASFENLRISAMKGNSSGTFTPVLSDQGRTIYKPSGDVELDISLPTDWEIEIVKSSAAGTLSFTSALATIRSRDGFVDVTADLASVRVRKLDSTTFILLSNDLVA